MLLPAEKHLLVAIDASHRFYQNGSMTMKIGEFARRARAHKMSQKLRFEEAFERAKRDLRELGHVPKLAPASTLGLVPRRKSDRPILKLRVQSMT